MGLLDALFRRPLSRMDFVGRARSAVINGGQVRADGVVFDAATYAFTIDRGNETGTLTLDHLYREYVAAPAGERDAVFSVIATTAAELVAPPVTPEVARTRLALQVRPRTQPMPLTRTLAERLAVVLYLDNPSSMRAVNATDLEAWSLNADEAFDLAYGNLRERSAPPKFALVRNGVHRAAWLDSYDAARLVLPDVLTSVLGNGRQPVITVPSRDALLIVDREDAAGVHALIEETVHQFQGPRSISQRLLTVIDGNVRPLELRRDDPLYELTRKQDLVDLASDYVAMQAAVQQEFGLPLDLPGLATTPTREAFSFARWQDGREAILPRVDLIALTSSEAEGTRALGAFPLERLLTICDDLFEQVNEDYPVLFRTHGFPTAAQRDRLGPSLATIGPAKASELRSVAAKRI